MSSKICDEDGRLLKLVQIALNVFPKAFYLLFKWGCKKKPNESIKDYLMRKGMSNRDYKRWFNVTMQDRIEADPTGQTYDVSLLWTCIRVGCDDLARGDKELESHCTTIKNYRNEIFHKCVRMCDDTAMHTWCTTATKVLEKLLELAGLRYSIPDHDTKQEIKDIKEQINKIMNAPVEDPEKLYEQMLRLRREHMNTVNEQGKNELSEKYKHISKVDPASFLTGKESLHVVNVFTELQVVCENKGKDKVYDVQYNELLKVKTEEDKEPTIIILEGDAGAGKTTLTKLILSDWAEGSAIFEGLDDYDLVLRGEGKNKHITSYLELIQVLMPMVSDKFNDADLIRSVLQLKVLLVMDGFDELNAGSENLMKELSEKQIPKSNGKLKLLITTRPSKLTALLNLVKSHSVVQTKLEGVSFNKRVEFISTLHDEMRKEKQSTQKTQELIHFMKHSQSRLGDHYRLPLNLTLLTYLWASDPNKVNPETTVTGLYIAFLELLKSRLLARLQYQVGVSSLSDDDCEEAMESFLKELYIVCLDTLSSGFMQLSDQSVKSLKKKCKQLYLPFNEMAEAFLVVEKEWTSVGYKTDLTVPHKSIIEFYAANAFISFINDMNDSVSQKANTTSLGIINKHCNPEDAKPLKMLCQKHLKTDLPRYENMFLHLTGLLAHQVPNRLQEYAQELVEVLRDAGFKRTKWFNVLVEAKCDETLAGLLAPSCSQPLTVCDGHTGAAAALFKHLKTNKPVRVFLENEVAYNPHLDDMLLQLSKRDCDVSFYLKHQWKHPECGFSDDHLNYLLHGKEDGQSRCRVVRFMGHLRTLSRLPKSLTKLRITFATNEHARQLLNEMPDLMRNNNIEEFGVRVMPDIQPDGLSPLLFVNTKTKNCGDLYLPKVAGDLKVVCNVIKALHPLNGMFGSIRFPQNSFSVSQCKEIISELGRLEVKVSEEGGLWFSSSINKELTLLSELVKSTLGCKLRCRNDLDYW